MINIINVSLPSVLCSIQRITEMGLTAHTHTHERTHARTHTHTHTRTRTHTHVCFCEKWGHPIGVIVFILYKQYVLLPYTYPTPKLSPHRRRCISIFPQKNSLCMIYKRFGTWVNVLIKLPSTYNTCHTCVTIQIHVLICHKNAHTHNNNI